VYLTDRGGGQRLLVEVEEEPLDGLAQLFANRPLDVGERERPDVVLEAAQLEDDVRRKATSGRVDRSCPNFTNVGPNSSNISRRCRPRAVPVSPSTSRRPSTT